MNVLSEEKSALFFLSYQIFGGSVRMLAGVLKEIRDPCGIAYPLSIRLFYSTCDTEVFLFFFFALAVRHFHDSNPTSFLFDAS